MTKNSNGYVVMSQRVKHIIAPPSGSMFKPANLVATCRRCNMRRRRKRT